MTANEILRLLAFLGWLACLACLLPAIIRLCRLRGKYLDPIWAIVFLLALNRISFLSRLSSEASLATGFVLALAMGGFSLWYQRHDA